VTNASEISIAGMNIFPKELEAKKRYRKNVVKYGNMLADICSYEYDKMKINGHVSNCTKASESKII
jgi:hypothetical protein